MNVIKKTYLIFLFLLLVKNNFSQQNFSQYVNPFIGTGGAGHTFPGAVLPFGMVQLSPDTRVDGSWEGCSGYHYSDSSIYGFSHTHLSGTGVSDWGDILVMPMLGEPSMDNKIYASKFLNSTEKASAGFYEVVLQDDNINAQLTTTLRTGIHKYTFPKAAKANVILDLLHRDKTLECNLTIIDSVTISGYRVSQAWAKEQHIYFVLKFSKPFTKMQFAVNKKFIQKINANQKAQGAYFEFDNTDNKPLMLKVAISPVSINGALKNLIAEAPHWNFEKYKYQADSVWNKQLQKIEVQHSDKNVLTTFYTALYHCFIHPSLSMDVDGTYRGRDNQLHTTVGFTNYSVFSLWDTYRTLHPLFTLLERKRTTDFINTFLNQYQQSKRLPMWELSSNETDCMIGFHATSVIADAMVKGISGFDSVLMYQAVKASASYSNFGIPIFNKKRFLQIDDESESVSKSLEYSYDNWCVAQIAQYLKKPLDVKIHTELAQAYKNLFDVTTGNMRPRKNGNWLSPFYPNEINNHFTEGNSWQYSFYVPQDIEGLIKLHGGKQNFENKLDELFTTTQKTSGREQADVTGLIGQYAQGNEPSHHMAYLYNYVGKPQKTINIVHKICNEFYKNTPNGLIGNEDCGQMSAWYVFSAIGFYPVCPGSPLYVLSQPIFKNVKINFEDSASFIIENNAPENQIVSGYEWNTKKLVRSVIHHNQIQNGGKLAFNFLNKNDTSNNYGRSGIKNLPPSRIITHTIIPSPIINANQQVFKTNVEVSINIINYKPCTIVYTIDGSEPTVSSTIYTKPFIISNNATVKTKLYDAKDSSITTTAILYKLKYNYDVVVTSTANAQYSASGSNSLIDGLYGDSDWRKGNWLGYQYQDFECVIDLKQKQDISYLSLNCLQDSRSWILMPTQVNFYTSNDNINFTLIASVDNTIKAADEITQLKKFEKKLLKKTSTNYIKIIAKNYGKLPQWHQGKGDGAFVFVDELEIK